MSILDREAKIFRFLFESAVFEREFAAEVLSTTVNFQRFNMTPFNGEGPVRRSSLGFSSDARRGQAYQRACAVRERDQ